MPKAKAIIGVSDHTGWAVLMTVSSDAKLLDRRRIELIDAGLPNLPHHHDAQSLPLEAGAALIERVRASAERNAQLGLDAVARSVPARIVGLALREDPPLPATVAERIADYRAQCCADGVMYRGELAAAARDRGWTVHKYVAKTVFDAASRALAAPSLDALFAELRRTLGPPWGKDQKLAMAAAIASTRSVRSKSS